MSNTNTIQHEPGQYLLVTAQNVSSIDLASELLGVLIAELEARVNRQNLKDGLRPLIGTSTLVHLEQLTVELSTCDHEIRLSKVEGSSTEFDELCDFTLEYGNIANAGDATN